MRWWPNYDAQQLRIEVKELKVAQTRTPEDIQGNLRLPTTLFYNGTTVPLNHIIWYQAVMRMKRQTPAAMYHAFFIILTEIAFEWFQRLGRGMIHSFEDLGEKFRARFATSPVGKNKRSYLLITRQGSIKSVQRYTNRFTEESNKVGDYNDKDAIYALTNGRIILLFLSIVGSQFCISEWTKFLKS